MTSAACLLRYTTAKQAADVVAYARSHTSYGFTTWYLQWHLKWHTNIRSIEINLGVGREVYS